MGRPLDETTWNGLRRPGAWVNGAWVPSGPATPFTFKASKPQPAGPATIDMGDEGATSEATFQIYVHDDQDELYAVEPGQQGYAADVVSLNGKSYLVTGNSDWRGVSLGHNAYVLTEYGPEEQVPS